MTNPNYTALAKQLICNSLALKKNEKVLIELTDTPPDFAVALLKQVRAVGALPLLQTYASSIMREYIAETTGEHAKLHADIEFSRMKKVDAYIAVRGANNSLEYGDIPQETFKTYSKAIERLNHYRINKTRWVVLRWPTPAAAQAAGVSTQAFEDFYFKVCCANYKAMRSALMPLYKLMNATDKVHLKGPKLDLRFSIKGIGSVMCYGDRNIPDGEIFSCPQKYSVEGEIEYNAPSIYLGSRFSDVYFKFEKGKIVQAKANDTDKINKILDTDAGARYIGEFALGVNPYIKHPTGDILFDEKISGSFHFTPGRAYEVGGNGNISAVHWDLVNIQRKDYGGGEIWFDGKLIRKDGLFVPKELKGLNPDKLK